MENFENLEKEIKIQEQELSTLKSRIKEMRENYKKQVKDYYDREQPFLKNRQDSETNFENDLTNFQEIIRRCLIAGDDELLEIFLIKPLVEDKDLSILARRDKIEDYTSAIDSFKSSPVSDTEEKYFDKLEKALIEFT